MIWPLYRYILMAAMRDRLFLFILGLIVMIFSLSVFFGNSAIVEKDQFARVFAAFGFRLFGVVSLAMFVITYLRRCFENRDIEYLLSRPIGRLRFVLTHAAAFSTLAAVAALMLGGTTVALETGALHDGVWLWWLSIGVEFVIMANVAMFFAFVMTSASGCMLVVFAFYLLSRLMGDILGILQGDKLHGVRALLAQAMEVISVFCPRLDMMGQTKWILYDMPPDLPLAFVLGQGLVFTALVIAATCIDMNKRQF
ncbi:MAG: hypothetical protein DI551_09650 [Micavibrio aeruginosavorus]|uniref:Uncharacterized protein n=1 Tax=Micavibrio aeruginosavorus TaxID=349221 RepID=A0A2W5MWI4_9BACT|nr:MAG: hypothetical protein DI551_09650 [Micavibrio aeruginosavorus]